MKDRELLELAALAIGKVVTGWTNQGGEEVAVLDGGSYWQPLLKNGITDCDGDAFRMAVDLDLPFRRAYNGTFETGNDKSGFPIWEARGDDPRAAARRAITRAAAVIGYHMKK